MELVIDPENKERGYKGRYTVIPGPCVVFDVDGTLIDVSGRRDVDKAMYGDDLSLDVPNAPVVKIARMFVKSETQVVVTTSRKARLGSSTAFQLLQCGVYYDHMEMRADDDNRSDDIVKSEMLDRILALGFMPLMWFDDRDRVVKMVRSRGIPCFQVAPGDF